MNAILSELTRAHPQSGDGELRHRAAAEIERLTAEVDRLRAALRKAEQLAIIASDWNLDEVEIDGEMVDTYDLRDEFRAALTQEKTDD
jgi:hypothetical protein